MPGDTGWRLCQGAWLRRFVERGWRHQVHTLDYKERNGKWIETLPEEVVDEVLARVQTLLD
jgi:hypothetical protein